MIDQVDELIKKILEVPFGSNHYLRKELLEQLKKDFFAECFVFPSYDIKKNIYKLNEPVKTAFEIDLPMKEIIDKADAIRNDERALSNWLNDQTYNVFYIRGDAGTGKTTYLHWLKYDAEQLHPENGWKWEIIDLADAVEDIAILDSTVHIPKFNTLYYKVISAIIKLLNSKLYPEKIEQKPINHERSAAYFQKLYNVFEKEFDCFYPDSRIRAFFNNLPLKSQNNEEKSNRRICEDCGHFVAQSFDDFLNTLDSREALSLFLQLYLYILRCFDIQARFVIAIDNVERIIGSDEIFNADITKFATTLRTMQTAVADNNPSLQQFYKLAVFMRNTSVRMLTPQQITDTRANTFDMSDWFDVEAIIFNKLRWYEKQGEKLEVTEEILDILHDNYEESGNLRGLYTKLKMIFNNNKRVIVHFMTRVLGKETNRTYVAVYNQLRQYSFGNLNESLTRFATRSIIYRLILNEMRQDNFFHAIMTEPSTETRSSENHKEKEGQKANNQKKKIDGAVAIGYARRILTLTYEHELMNREDPYMPLDVILCTIFNIKTQDIDLFYSMENLEKRKTIAEILFTMNYYDGRKGDWLQFIDIQYYPGGKYKNVRISKADKLQKILEQGVEKIGIKIMPAGVAYLYFISFSYEYFACKSINTHTRKEIIGEFDIPPLLCTIPSREQIVKSKLADLECIKTIEVVLIEALKCITKMNRDEQQGFNIVPFRRTLDEPFVKHTVRIMNSHRGYLDNFIECLSELFKKDKEDKEFGEHFDLMISTIRKLRDCYQSNANDEISEYKNKIQEILLEMQQKKDKLCKN